MERYKNLSGKSNIHSYQIDNESITILFNDGWFYSYSNTSAGFSNIDQMQLLAKNGFGLNSFIMRHVRKLYAKKWH